ncbi:MAG: hypothetical protein J7501_15720 [Bdellovibrio sp.]|nr:hypothetical protein [Bdellovibrio sp.]
MRTILATILLVLIAGAAEACVGFSGAYSTFRAAAGKYHVLVLDQNDCKAIAAGSFQLDQQTSVVSDEIKPKILYVDTNHTQWCELTHCRIFKTTKDGLEFEENASVYLDGVICRYDRVSWSRQDTWDLKISYHITDPSAPCRKYRGTASVVMKDIKQH